MDGSANLSLDATRGSNHTSVVREGKNLSAVHVSLNVRVRWGDGLDLWRCEHMGECLRVGENTSMDTRDPSG